jgi:hypothetical protein
MARTVDLKKVKREFIDGVLAPTENAWLSPPAAVDARRLLAENSFLRLAIGWDVFVSDWFIGCASHDTTRFRRTLESRMLPDLQSVLTKSVLQAHLPKAQPPTSTLARQPGLKVVRDLLDPAGRNLEFDSLQRLIQEAADKLAPRYAKRAASLPAMGMADVIEPTIKIRNAIGHRSPKSVTEMYERIRAIAAIPALRKPSVSKDGVGTYLAASIAGRPRFLIFKDHFVSIANTLVP